MLYLGALYQRHFRTSEIVPPVLERIVAELHEGASFYICEATSGSACTAIEARARCATRCTIGDRLPLTVGAAGHVLRAFNGARGERFDEIRDAMYAASYGERDAEIAAVAARCSAPATARSAR